MRFLKAHKGVVPPGSYLERNKDSWTIVSLDPLEIKEGRPFLKRQTKTNEERQAAKNQSSYIPKDRVDYYVITGEERRGPYKLKQIESMWLSGAIPADVTLQCGDSEPIPITSVLRWEIQPSMSSPKAVFGLCVRLLGLFLFYNALMGANGALLMILSAGGGKDKLSFGNVVIDAVGAGIAAAKPVLILIAVCSVAWPLLLSILLMMGGSRIADMVYRSKDA